MQEPFSWTPVQVGNTSRACRLHWGICRQGPASPSPFAHHVRRTCDALVPPLNVVPQLCPWLRLSLDVHQSRSFTLIMKARAMLELGARGSPVVKMVFYSTRVVRLLISPCLVVSFGKGFLLFLLASVVGKGLARFGLSRFGLALHYVLHRVSLFHTVAPGKLARLQKRLARPQSLSLKVSVVPLFRG